jgi:uncharacterized protein
MALRPDSWAGLATGDDRDAAEALSHLSTLIAIANDESSLDSVEINAVHDQAPADLASSVLQLYAARARAGGGVAATAVVQPIKIGRNDPCRCGSGRKSKRCCG